MRPHCLEASDELTRLAPRGFLSRQLNQWCVRVLRLSEIRDGPLELTLDLYHHARIRFEDVDIEQDVLLIDVARDPADQLDAGQRVSIQLLRAARRRLSPEADEHEVGDQGEADQCEAPPELATARVCSRIAVHYL